MIKIENVVTPSNEQWKSIVMGARNPMNSWDYSDSSFDGDNPLGNHDIYLLISLSHAGSDHRKYMRMIPVFVDITAPLYWWKQFDTYKIGTVSNSCSTMHKIHAKEFEISDFSHDHLFDNTDDSIDLLQHIIGLLNHYRLEYIETKNKDTWWQMIQILPNSYNQKRTLYLNYETLFNMYHSRKNHKLDEWCRFCEWVETLPYSEIITW